MSAHRNRGIPASLVLAQILVFGAGVTRAIYLGDNPPEGKTVTRRVLRVAPAVGDSVSLNAPVTRERESATEAKQEAATATRAVRGAPVAGNCPVARLGPAPGVAGRAIYTTLPIYRSPTDTTPMGTLKNPTHEGMPLTVLVRQQWQDWLLVQLPVRPNGQQGWIKASEVKQHAVRTRVIVERCARRVTVLRDGVVIFQRRVAVGKPRTPTPLGEFYVDYIVRMSPRGAYAGWLVSVAGFSEVLKSFGGGIGQIALHGTHGRWAMGQAASNGCVRMLVEDISVLARMVTAGTPVSIVA